MLHLSDISLRRRLLMANFTMVFVPIFILSVLGFLLISGLRFSSPHNDLAGLWPEKGPALSIQYTVSSLRVKAERPGPLKVKDMREDCRVLEDLGIATAIIRNDQVAYITPGIDFPALADAVLRKANGQPTVMTWDGDGFFFRYTSPRSGTTVIAAGHIPFIAKTGIREGIAKSVLQTILTFIVITASVIIIACGLILSRLLSRQILTPLAALRQAASEIEKGNLDYALQVPSRDELGRTCTAFDRMRRQLKASREAQEKYEQNRKELIAGISHDLSTPLTLLKGYASGILVGIAKTAEKRHHYVELIYQNACTLEKLVDRLFLFSKLDLGQVSFAMETVSLRDYFTDFVAENKQRLAERGLILHYAAPSGPARAAIDRMQFQRIVDNLLENSLKYKEKGTVAMDIVLRETPESVVLTFADDGPGVPTADLPRLFDSFYRTDAARTDVKKGSGLGLAIVRQIIAALHGSIRAAETPGGGLSIIITLPRIEGKNHETNLNH
ncbi:MAG: ATP-binding protein [Megasphaera sp.]|uniref:sensor histidine kinase n=1 Tax=Megasphaera sp. TaxID=2023260 RepID=UPI003F10AAE2